ncbi:hypothetical protein MES4922_230180 [Mesorhizobium ventifaucium]|uniref:Uncharacterized protein n=1 Tax=Mesorhizobium ventifaucium TaxID=666020 RepID=A0ABM9DU05_9HYPH|nr:hypothetical protein MES4922_230180 [Mesorhizobium ventifaucium]
MPRTSNAGFRAARLSERRDTHRCGDARIDVGGYIDLPSRQSGTCRPETMNRLTSRLAPMRGKAVLF